MTGLCLDGAPSCWMFFRGNATWLYAGGLDCQQFFPIESTNTGSPQIYLIDVVRPIYRHNHAPNPMINGSVFVRTWSPYITEQFWQDGKSWDELEREAELIYRNCYWVALPISMQECIALLIILAMEVYILNDIE